MLPTTPRHKARLTLHYRQSGLMYDAVRERSLDVRVISPIAIQGNKPHHTARKPLIDYYTVFFWTVIVP